DTTAAVLPATAALATTPAVVVIGLQVDTSAAARRLARGTGKDAPPAHAGLTAGTAHAASAAVVRIRAGVDAAPAAKGELRIQATTAPAAAALAAAAGAPTDAAVVVVALQAHTAPIAGGQRVRA